MTLQKHDCIHNVLHIFLVVLCQQTWNEKICTIAGPANKFLKLSVDWLDNLDWHSYEILKMSEILTDRLYTIIMIICLKMTTVTCMSYDSHLAVERQSSKARTAVIGLSSDNYPTIRWHLSVRLSDYSYPTVGRQLHIRLSSDSYPTVVQWQLSDCHKTVGRLILRLVEIPSRILIVDYILAHV